MRGSGRLADERSVYSSRSRPANVVFALYDCELSRILVERACIYNDAGTSRGA